MPVHILIADVNNIMREGLSSILSALSDVESIVSVSTVKETTRICDQQYLDMAIINLNSMPEEGLKIAEKLHCCKNKIGIIGLLKYYKNEDVVRLVKCGTSAFLPVNCEADELINAVKIVMDGGSLMNHILLPVVTDLAFRHVNSKNTSDKSCLTTRENEILELIIDGLAIQDIAKKLELSVHTVYTHKRNIKEKLDASNDVQLAKNVLFNMRPNSIGMLDAKPAA